MKMILVTVKLRSDPYHDPKSKKEGVCPIGSAGSYCSDKSGAHHTLAAKSWQEVEALRLGYHVTRVEEVVV